MSALRKLGPTVELTINGRALRVARGEVVLGVAREAGIVIPTLCDHPGLEPSGACRVCLVEVSHPDWHGWKGLVTSCLYPVTDGLVVETDNETVRAARGRVLSLLAARCPDAPAVTTLAERYGADTTGLVVDTEEDSCILCGLCVRVCQAHATSTLTACERGTSKRISTFADRPPEECVGCGACAEICPTGHIAGHRTAFDYRIWGREFPTRVCRVEPERCVGCGSCEAECPFSVPRVTLRRDGAATAVIPTEQCRGCGCCVGACPTAAIEQEGLSWTEIIRPGVVGDGPGAAAPYRDRTVVMACGRTGLLPQGGGLWSTMTSPYGGGEIAILGLPCTGRASVALMLGLVAGCASGVLVLGRAQETCRLAGSEEPVVRRVEAARQLLGLLGH